MDATLTTELARQIPSLLVLVFLVLAFMRTVKEGLTTFQSISVRVTDVLLKNTEQMARVEKILERALRKMGD